MWYSWCYCCSCGGCIFAVVLFGVDGVLAVAAADTDVVMVVVVFFPVSSVDDVGYHVLLLVNVFIRIS